MANLVDCVLQIGDRGLANLFDSVRNFRRWQYCTHGPFRRLLSVLLLARRVTVGGPQPLEKDAIDGVSETTRNLPSLKENPWEASGSPLEGRALRVLGKLIEEGDEIETRRAWLEELSEHTICPICGGEILAETKGGRTWIKCGVSESHLTWP